MAVKDTDADPVAIGNGCGGALSLTAHPLSPSLTATISMIM